MMVTMCMEEYKRLEAQEAKLRSVKKMAKDILSEHCEDKDWCKWSELKEALTLDESQLLMKKILEE